MHLQYDVSKHGGLINNFPGLALEQLDDTCALDVAGRGTNTLQAVGDHMNFTRERVRQVLAIATQKLARAAGGGALREHATWLDDARPFQKAYGEEE